MAENVEKLPLEIDTELVEVSKNQPAVSYTREEERR